MATTRFIWGDLRTEKSEKKDVDGELRDDEKDIGRRAAVRGLGKAVTYIAETKGGAIRPREPHQVGFNWQQFF